MFLQIWTVWRIVLHCLLQPLDLVRTPGSSQVYEGSCLGGELDYEAVVEAYHAQEGSCLWQGTGLSGLDLVDLRYYPIANDVAQLLSLCSGKDKFCGVDSQPSRMEMISSQVQP